MMIDLKSVLGRYGINPKGIIQVGAHWAEEHEELVKLGIRNFVYIEPCKDAFEILSKKQFGGGVTIDTCTCIRSACGADKGEMPMYVSHQNQGQSNSLLKPNLHLSQHPEVVFDDAEIVPVDTLDNLIEFKHKFDILMMDVQGAEGLVLKGATETLKHIDVIYTEVNRGQTYEGNMEIEEMDAFLAEKGFVRIETYWPSPSWTWGDAIYLKRQR